MSTPMYDVPNVCPEAGCTKAFGHELDPTDTEHGDGMYKGAWTYYLVEGINPEPWKAPDGSVGRNAGKLFVRMTSPASSKAFTEGLREEFRRQNPHAVMMEGKLEVIFYVCRQVSDYEADTGRKAKANYADSTNMQKLIEDALQGILYDNDRDNVDVRLRQMMQSPHAEPMILVAIRPDQGAPTEIWKMMYALREEAPKLPSNQRPKEYGADGLF